MDEKLMQMIQAKRVWTESAKCAEKECSIVAADFACAQAKDLSKEMIAINDEQAI